MTTTVDGSEIRLTSSHGKYTIIYRVSYISNGAGFQPSAVVLFEFHSKLNLNQHQHYHATLQERKWWNYSDRM